MISIQRGLVAQDFHIEAEEVEEVEGAEEAEEAEEDHLQPQEGETQTIEAMAQS